jgi:hypothetical protein
MFQPREQRLHQRQTHFSEVLARIVVHECAVVQFVRRKAHTRVVNPGIPEDFGIVKSRDLNFGIFGIILIPGFVYRDPGPFGIDFIS